MLKRSYFFYIFDILMPIILFADFLISPRFHSNVIFRIITLICAILFSIFAIVFRSKGRESLSRGLFVINIFFAVSYTVLMVLDLNDLGYIFSSISNLRAFILYTKGMGKFVYILIQIAQVVFVPIPAAIITLAGAAIWGPLVGGILDSIGVLLGSYLSFIIGKIFGFRVVAYVAGKDNALKYAKIINDRGKFFLIYAFLLPFFPDDILCLIAGMTTMKFSTFFLIAGITRPIGVMCMSYFGSGSVIPFSGWGIFAWIIILIVSVAAVILLTTYQERIEKFFLDKVIPKKKEGSK